MAQERVTGDVVKTAGGSYNLSSYEPRPGGREVQDLSLPTTPEWAKKSPDGGGGVCNFVNAIEA